MKNLPGVLAFSTALLLAAGCHRNTGEGTGATDAAVGAPSEGTQTGTQRGAMTSTTDDAGTVTVESPNPTTDAGITSRDGGEGMAKGTGGNREAMEACVDQWLKANKLDPYGHDEGTMYAGGTPLFDESTGERKDRLEYVFQRKPEARKACAK
ncbi:hypothetical protein [Pyxidicoccus fallax]|nr:hypothetical protein [Pyxidicoccus fallax]